MDDDGHLGPVRLAGLDLVRDRDGAFSPGHRAWCIAARGGGVALRSSLMRGGVSLRFRARARDSPTAQGTALAKAARALASRRCCCVMWRESFALRRRALRSYALQRLENEEPPGLFS